MELFWYFYVFLIGSIVGSFLNVCICRLPEKESIVTGRSHCPSCGHVLSFFEMIPIISYLFLRGKCRKCNASISIQYPLIEGCNAVCWLLCVLRFGFTAKALLCAIFASILLVLAGIDLRTMEFPDRLHVWILGLAIVQLFLEPSLLTGSILGFFLISVPMLILSLLTNGFGGGDIKLCAVCGLFLGAGSLLIGFFLACILASLSGLFLLARKKLTAKTPFPFGPYLAFGFILAALFGEPLLNTYLKLFL